MSHGIFPPIIARRLDTFLFALTLLASASLLFTVQPMIGKMLLPRLGGTPAVWNTCMLFFQACLLGGYAYAHGVATRLRFRTGAVLHLALLCAALFTLPIGFGTVSDAPVDRNPIPWLLLVLATSAGAAFFVVSASAPLLQRWYAGTGRDPYFLYAASNAGSLAALVAYPLVVEPSLRSAQQARVWTCGYVALIVLTALCAARTRGRVDLTTVASEGEHVGLRPDHYARLDARTRWMWVLLTFVPSSYLLGVTTFISSDIAAVPLMWVVPLALYLLTFVLVFASKPPIPHAVVTKILPPIVLLAVMMIMARASQPVWLVLAVHLLAFFVATLACHGELARRRPPPQQLTDFYLMLSVGGALGGAFNAIVAPLLFDRPLEYPIAIALACLVSRPRRADAGDNPRAAKIQEGLDYVLPLIVGVFAVLTVKMVPARTVRQALPLMLIFLSIPALLTWTFAKRPIRFGLGVALLLLPAALLPPAGSRQLDIRRSFFGVHRVLRTADGQFNQLFHGTTMHGSQRVDPATGKPVAPDEPTSYYYPDSPYAQVFRTLGETNPAPRVGVAGLGGGSLAGFAKPGWDLRFFEIDLVVVWAAERSGHFSFVPAARDRGATVTNVLGDARLTIARQPDGSFDLIALDAFSGDSIPVHLLTREAVAMYLTKLKPDGVLVIHISNLYLDLTPVVTALAEDAKLVALMRDDAEPPNEARDRGAQGSRLVVLARSKQALAPLVTDARWKPLGHPHGHASVATKRVSEQFLWTDDFSNLLQIVRWSRPPE